MATRGNFNSKLGFILAAAGSAVGLGNIWKFPFEVADGGGGAFVLLYLFFCFVLAFPILVSEIAIGRKTKLNPVGAVVALGHKKWKVIGYLGLIASFLILSYYNVVAGWVFEYFIQHVTGHFPVKSDFGTFAANWELVAVYSALFMSMTMYIVAQGVTKGIERAGKILMPSLLVIILLLTAYSFTLAGAGDGLTFYLYPDFSKISLETVKNALGQSFFSLSLGMGALITYGSYLTDKENIISSSVYITLMDVLIAFLAGLMIFPFVFSMDVPETTGGAGLIFATLPEIFKGMGPILGLIVGSTFFLLLAFAALTSTVSLLEVPVSFLIDTFKMKRRNAVILAAFLIFLVGIPSSLSQGSIDFFTEFITYPGKDSPTSFFNVVDEIANNLLLPLGGVLISFFAAYIWGKLNLDKEISKGYPEYENSISQKIIHVGVSYISPIVLTILLILSILETYLGIKLI